MVARSLGILGLVAAAGTAAHDARAVPKVGGRAPEAARVIDVEDRVLAVKDLAGAPALVMYEDKDSSKLNEALKKELEKVVAAEPALRAVRVVAVADVSEYDFWPAKGAVKDAIRDEQKKAKTTIWLDWTADFRTKLSLDEATSNVVLLDASGAFVFAKSGALSAADRKALIDAMRSLTKPT